MRLLLAILDWLVPTAHAVVLQTAGSSNPGVQSMWTTICQTMPFCGVGLLAPGFFGAKLVRFILSIIGGTAVVVIIYGGIKMLLSQGSEEALTEARKIVMYAAAGLILALLANVVIFYVSSVVLPQALR